MLIVPALSSSLTLRASPTLEKFPNVSFDVVFGHELCHLEAADGVPYGKVALHIKLGRSSVDDVQLGVAPMDEAPDVLLPEPISRIGEHLPIVGLVFEQVVWFG